MRKIGGCVLYMWCFKSYLTLYLFAWPSTEGIMSYFSRVACYKSVYVCLSAVITSLLYVYCFNAFCVGDLWCLKLWNAECTTNSADSEAYQTLIISSGWLQTFMYFLFLEIFFFFVSYLFEVLWWYVLLKTNWKCYRKAALCCLRLSCDPHAAAQQGSWQI